LDEVPKFEVLRLKIRGYIGPFTSQDSEYDGAVILFLAEGGLTGEYLGIRNSDFGYLLAKGVEA
jgi:hypothetical protein